jgi:hypothetical protein
VIAPSSATATRPWTISNAMYINASAHVCPFFQSIMPQMPRGLKGAWCI